MISKSSLKKQIEKLPEQFSFDELIDQLIQVEVMERDEYQLEENEMLLNEEMIQIKQNWDKIALYRSIAVKNGQLKTIPAEQVFKDIP